MICKLQLQFECLDCYYLVDDNFFHPRENYFHCIIYLLGHSKQIKILKKVLPFSS